MDHGPKRSSSRTHREQSTVMDVDKTGEEVLAALKSVLRGTGGDIDRVFTIATTNESVDAFSDALLGRLKGVEIPTIQMLVTPKDSLRFGLYLRYEGYGEILPKILSLLRTAHFRRTKEKNPAIEGILEELGTLIEDLNQQTGKIWKKDIFQPYAGIDCRDDNRRIAVNELWRDALNKFLGIRLAESESHWNRKIFETGSFFETSPPPELIDLTQLSITQAYREHPERFQNKAFLKRELALMIFPQLARYPKFLPKG